MTQVDLAIIGGGVIGCAIAYELSRTSKKTIVLLERNVQISGDNQSSRNSGVIHAGIYYPPEKGPLKAELCVKGNSKLYDFCQEHNVPHRKVGKLVVATNSLEEEYLDDVIRIALQNKVPGTNKISQQEIKQLEPNVKAISAGYFPTSGIVDAINYVKKLASLAKKEGVIFLTGTEVKNIRPRKNSFEIFSKNPTTQYRFETKMMINAAGLYSDDIARMVNPYFAYSLDPVRGETAKFYKTKRNCLGMNGMNVYPVPYGFLPSGERLDVTFEEFKRLFEAGRVMKSVGVHLTPTLEEIDGKSQISKTVTIGPAYVGNVSKTDYAPTRDEDYYLTSVQQFFPDLTIEDIALHDTGIRAKLKDHYDFVIEKDSKFPNCCNLVGIDSPGLTSSLAIAEYVRRMMG